MTMLLKFPSGRVVVDGLPESLLGSAGGSTVGLDSIAVKPAERGIQLFEAASAHYEATQKSRRELAAHAEKLHAAWVDAFDAYALAVQANIEARDKFKKAAAGIDPDSGLTV